MEEESISCDTFYNQPFDVPDWWYGKDGPPKKRRWTTFGWQDIPQTEDDDDANDEGEAEAAVASMQPANPFPNGEETSSVSCSGSEAEPCFPWSDDEEERETEEKVNYSELRCLGVAKDDDGDSSTIGSGEELFPVVTRRTKKTHGDKSGIHELCPLAEDAGNLSPTADEAEVLYAAAVKERRLRGGGPDNDLHTTGMTGITAANKEAETIRRSNRPAFIERQKRAALIREEEENRKRELKRSQEQRKLDAQEKRLKKKEEKEAEKAEMLLSSGPGKLDREGASFEPEVGSAFDKDLLEEGEAHDDLYTYFGFLEEVRAMNAGKGNSSDMVDEKILRKLLEQKVIEKETYSGLSPSLAVEVDLLKVLLDGGCSLKMFEEILKWAKRSTGNPKFSFDDFCIRERKAVMKDLYLKGDLAGLQPLCVPMRVIGVSTVVDMVIHDFREVVYSLLRCKICMVDENLLWGETPFETTSDPNSVDDINDGLVFQQAAEEFIENKALEVLLPIIFFVDKTHTDLFGNLCLEPVLLTLGIFKRRLRYRPESWRSVGYILNQSLMKYKKPCDKVTDYHAMLSVVLESVKKSMKSEGLAWCLEYKGKTHKIIFKPYVQFIIGDTVGHNTLCGHYQGGGNDKIASMCRICDVVPADMDKANVNFNYTKMKDVRDKVEEKDEKWLKEHSFHLVKNAFHDLKYVDGHPDAKQKHRKLHLCVMGEILHMTQLGWHKYGLIAFFDMKKRANKPKGGLAKKPGGKRKSPHAKAIQSSETDDDADDSNSDTDDNEFDDKANMCSDGDDSRYDRPLMGKNESVYDAKDEKNKKYRVFTNSEIPLFEKVAAAIGGRLQQQSDRNMSRTKFGQGISKGTKMAGHEVQGALLLCALVLVSSWGHDRYSKEKMIGPDRIQSWLGLFEMLMCFEELGKTEVPFRKDQKERLERTIKAFMTRFKRTLRKGTGRKLKTPKFHLVVHMVMDLLNHGLWMNAFGGMCESRLKEDKNRARETQRRKVNFEKQTATRTVEAIALRQAHHAFVNEGLIRQPRKGTSKHKAIQGGKYAFDFDRKQVTRCGEVCRWKDAKLQERVEAFMLDNGHRFGVEDSSTETKTTIEFFSEYKPCLDERSEHCDTDEPAIYRATPSWYYSNDGPRRDWVYVKQPNGKVPCHIITYLKARVERTTSDGDIRFETVEYAMCETVGEPIVDHHKKTCEMREEIEKGNLHHDSELEEEDLINQQNPESRLFFCARKSTTTKASNTGVQEEPKIVLIPVHLFLEPCIAIPDIPLRDEKRERLAIYAGGDPYTIEDPLGNYLFVRPRSEWPDIFMKELDFSAV